MPDPSWITVALAAVAAFFIGLQVKGLIRWLDLRKQIRAEAIEFIEQWGDPKQKAQGGQKTK